MSKKIFSAQEWENVPSKVQQENLPLKSESNSTIYDKVENDVECVVGEIERRAIDITSDYKDWVSLGFALADGLGERGRSYYHRISRFYPGYQEGETDRQYSHCLQSHGSGITISTFFHLAQQAGVSIHANSFSIFPNTQNGKTVKWIKGANELPSFPERVFSDLPPFLAEVVANSISTDDRDTILIGAIATLSVCFYNMSGVYDERIVYPNLYLFVAAEAGMGKGSLTLCYELVASINRNLRELSNRLEQEYRAAMAEYVKGKKSAAMEMPTEPKQRMLVVPANSSASSFQNILSDNDGILLMFETEGDTLSQTLRTEYGNYSDALRKGYHHEPIAKTRCKNREYNDIENPRISVVLAGTPEQVHRLIPSSEDGLLSRFAIYNIPFKRGIRNVFATSDVSQSKNAKFRILGDRFMHLQEAFMRQGEYTFYVPSHLQMQFVTFLRQVNEECCDEVDNNMQGIVRRLGLMTFRIMMVLTAVRTLDLEMYKLKPSADGTIHLLCEERDYITAMDISTTLLYHSVFIYRKLAGLEQRLSMDRQEKGVAARRNAFFGLLPLSFTKKEYDALVEEQGENASTASKWIDIFIRERRLRRTGQGCYSKTCT